MPDSASNGKKEPDKVDLPLATKAVLYFHHRTLELAVEANLESNKRYETSPKSLVRSAIWALSHDSVCTHQAIFDACRCGWSSSGAVLVRTLMDLTISTVAILSSSNPELAAFKYFFSSYRTVLRDPSYRGEVLDVTRKLCREYLLLLAESDRKEAKRFLHNERKMAYWYSGEFTRPSEVIEKHLPSLQGAFTLLSAAAHGGFLGTRAFRDDPDFHDVNPRRPKETAELVLMMSSRLLLEQTRLRAESEGLGIKANCLDLAEKLGEFVTRENEFR